MTPVPLGEFHETEDRIGAIENLHIQGYYKLWDEIILRNPCSLDRLLRLGRPGKTTPKPFAVPFRCTIPTLNTAYVPSSRSSTAICSSGFPISAPTI